MTQIDRVEPVRWGIIGAGSFVCRVATMPAMVASPHSTIVAVVSSQLEVDSGLLPRGATAHGSIESLLKDRSVDAVYLPLPNHLHTEMITRALDAQKHVLCEKPLATDPHTAEELYRYAQSKGKILAEAYMTYYHPRHRAVISRFSPGGDADAQMITSSFTGTLRQGIDNYRWRGSLGGGSLSDVGIYALGPVYEIFGASPPSISVVKHLEDRSGMGDPTDTYLSATLSYLAENGDHTPQIAHIECSFQSGEHQRLTIISKSAVTEVDRACTPTEGDDTFSVTGINGESTIERVPGPNPYRSMIDAISLAFATGVEPAWNSKKSIDLCRLLERVSKAPSWP